MTDNKHWASVVKFGWPIALLLAILWFPFDWLAQTWPAFGNPFRQVFRDAHDHFVGHTVFFFIVGSALLVYWPFLRRNPVRYFIGMALAALVQETVQALFRRQVPTYTDFNAFRGDALGSALAFIGWLILSWLGNLRRST